MSIRLTITGPSKRAGDTLFYVDRWTAGTEWPRQTDPVASLVHREDAGFAYFELDASEAYRLMPAVAKHPGRAAWLAALALTAGFTQLDASDVVRIARGCWRSLGDLRLVPEAHNDWAGGVLPSTTFALQARSQAGVGINNTVGVIAELVAMREEIADNALDIRERAIQSLRDERRRRARHRVNARFLS